MSNVFDIKPGMSKVEGNFSGNPKDGIPTGGGGGMDDVLRRLGSVESAVGEIKSDVSAVKATMPHLATKSDLATLRTDTSVIPHLATKADVSNVESALIKWIVGTMLGALSLAFIIARYMAP